MKSIKEWKMSQNENTNNDPDWTQLMKVWGSGTKRVDKQIVNMIRPKIQRIQDQYVNTKKSSDPNIENFNDLSSEDINQLAQAIVVATLSVFYGTLDSADVGGKSTMKASDFKRLDQKPQDIFDAPKGWEGE